MQHCQLHTQKKYFIILIGTIFLLTINMCDRGRTITHLQISRFHTQVWYNNEDFMRLRQPNLLLASDYNQTTNVNGATYFVVVKSYIIIFECTEPFEIYAYVWEGSLFKSLADSMCRSQYIKNDMLLKGVKSDFTSQIFFVYIWNNQAIKATGIILLQ